MKCGKLWGSVIGQKGMRLRVVNRGNLTRPVHSFAQVPLGVCPSMELRMLLSSGYREGTSLTWGSYDLVQGRWGRSESPSCTCLFSNSFSLKYSLCQGVPYLGVACPEPHHKLRLSTLCWPSQMGCWLLIRYLDHNSGSRSRIFQGCWPGCRWTPACNSCYLFRSLSPLQKGLALQPPCP